MAKRWPYAGRRPNPPLPRDTGLSRRIDSVRQMNGFAQWQLQATVAMPRVRPPLTARRDVISPASTR